MQYRLYGQDAISKEPRPPLDVEADNEWAAREQATELGMEVLQLEPMQPGGAEPMLPQAAASIPPARARASADAMRPRPRRWLVVCLVLVVAALGVGVGILLPRVSLTGPTTPTSTTASPAGIRLERLKSAEEMFDLAGQKAVALHYSGGDVEFWVEIESRGKKQKLGSLGTPAGLFDGKANPPAPDQVVEGAFVWVRDEGDEAGRETWRVACRRNVVAANTSKLQVLTPLGQADVSQSRENTQSAGLSWFGPVQVWDGMKPSGTGRGTISSLPSPLPVDREVCLEEIHETGFRLEDGVRSGAKTIGMLAAPMGGGPLLTAAALTPGRFNTPVEEHTIRVMCRAKPEQNEEAKGEPPAK